MKNYSAAILAILTVLLITCCKGKPVANPEMSAFEADTIIADCDEYVRFETTAGNFTIKLYRETPLHRHNMVRNARHGIYDGQLFFGIQKGYKIQCGDVNSKNAQPGQQLGINEKEDTIASEIQPTRFYHKRGAVGQASVTQFDYSTSQQFYIVTGRKAKVASLTDQEKTINKRYRKVVKDSLTRPYSKDIREWQKYKENKKISKLNDQLNKETDAIMATRTQFMYSQEQVDQYLYDGGVPSLDGLYTVFGEVIEGLEVVEEISNMHVDRNYRPEPDVRITRAIVLDSTPEL